MPVNLKIKVTKEILQKTALCGLQHLDGSNCAIALSVRDIFPLAHVTATDILPYGKYENCFYLNSKAAIRLDAATMNFIREFDSHAYTPAYRLLLPEHEFEVEIPDEVIQEINIDELKPLLENHPTLQLVTV